MRILLIGSNGQLGNAIIKSKPKNIDLITPDRKELDLRDIDSIQKKISNISPNWIINCGAYTNVDSAEKDNETAFLINHLATREIAKSTREIHGKFIHLSTDYVFDGKKKIPYGVSDKRSPINIYGKSKALGEKEIEKVLDGKNGIIIRTSWLISHIGDNFVKKILSFYENNQKMNIVDDQYGCITSTYSLAQACWNTTKFFNKNFPKGDKVNILHWSSKGLINWYQIAIKIGDIGSKLGIISNKPDIIPVKSNFFKQIAKRPSFSALDCSKSEDLLNLKLNNWEKELNTVLTKISCKKINDKIS